MKIKKINVCAKLALTNYLRLFRTTEYTNYTGFILFSVIIGIIAGFSAVIFHDAIEFFNSVFFKQTKEGLYFLGSAVVILIPVIGMFIQSLMIKLAPFEANQKGVYEVVKAVNTKNSHISLKTTLFNFLASAISIGSGVTLGPEGPAAQIGGGFANKISTLFALDNERIRIYTAAGAGAAIAAIFNTPLAGVFFTLEIILLNDFHTPTFSVSVISSVSASAVSRIFLGNNSVFSFEVIKEIQYSELYLYAIMGVLVGVISLAFIKLNEIFKQVFKKLIRSYIHQIISMIIVGFLIGVAGYYYKEIFGIGYKAINEILASKLSIEVVVIIFFLKFILVLLAINVGAFGGLFAPALFLGAGFGYIFHFILFQFLGINLDLATIVLISMGTMLGGIHTIPITAIMMIFEMTHDYSFILPLMLSVIISTMIVQISLKGTVHKKHLESEGISFQKSDPYSILSHIKVNSTELKDLITINENEPVIRIISTFLESPHDIVYVVNNNNELAGLIKEKDIRSILSDYEVLKHLFIIKDIYDPKIISIDSQDTLDKALFLMMKNNLTEIPVINYLTGKQKVLGILTLDEIQSILVKENLKKQFASILSQELRTLHLSNSIEIAESYSIREIKVPKKLIGKNLKETRLRNLYNVEILMIKKNQNRKSQKNNDTTIVTADPNYFFEENDILIVLGRNENILNFEQSNASN